MGGFAYNGYTYAYFIKKKLGRIIRRFWIKSWLSHKAYEGASESYCLSGLLISQGFIMDKMEKRYIAELGLKEEI